MPIDFTKLPSDKHVTVAIGPSGPAPLGVPNVDVPTAAGLNNTGGTSGMIPASQSISWNDYSFGTQASETLNEPSLADAATYEEFGTSNYGGDISFYYPADYDDNSNLHSVIYDLTDIPGTINDIVTRIDGDLETSVPFANGDFVSVYRAQGNSETNPFTPGESKRRTVGYNQKADFAHYTVVGPHVITAIAPATFAVGDKGRIRASVQGRDYTNALEFTTSNGAVINVYPGGFYEVLAAGTATVQINDLGAGTSTSVTVTAA